MAGLARNPFVCLAEWLNLQAVISVVRSVAGSSWCPSELCFVSSNRVPQAVLAQFPNTRILMGQRHTCVVIGHAALARTAHRTITAVAIMAGYGCPQHFTRAFRRFGGITPSEYRQHKLDGDSHATQAAGLAEQSPL
jgi:hypothetical protein